ncbi:MAG TPA: type II secretion system protein GspM [Gemmatimonadales bacterium]|nr:type II secretion system protein GspM [Gemmatimonadales bacterium]
MTPGDRRALLLGGAVAIVGWLGLRGVPWALREVQSRRSELAGKQALLARIRDDIRDAASLADSAPAVERRVLALAPKVLSGQSEAEALSDLTARVSAAATAHKAKLIRTVPLADSAHAGRLRRVALRAVLEGDATGLLGALGQLEQGATVLTVSELAIAASDPGSGSAAPEVLQGDMLVRGWYVERLLSSRRGKP